jgi:hypothetical protein
MNLRILALHLYGSRYFPVKKLRSDENRPAIKEKRLFCVFENNCYNVAELAGSHLY